MEQLPITFFSTIQAISNDPIAIMVVLLCGFLIVFTALVIKG